MCDYINVVNEPKQMFNFNEAFTANLEAIQNGKLEVGNFQPQEDISDLAKQLIESMKTK